MKTTKEDLISKLMELKNKGYLKVAFTLEQYGEVTFLDLLLIHKDWKEYSFMTQYDQADRDLNELVDNKRIDWTLEIPTLEMYLNHRNEDAPVQSTVVFDLTSN